jgi:hypothetical protein
MVRFTLEEAIKVQTTRRGIATVQILYLQTCRLRKRGKTKDK